ncbi:hypothetical protein MILUP08_45876 [Micromonospora lupini str. Lupac 08]|uniref:Uncharacterized protein n=1 Tax=Micromonospora lupini str. Lupac 08 TaxID=1150864 RepID=I0LAY5_9ACTN|nr:hypothetical protein MILUP08_45876 [Micromonospora lupini str. Lupac 08]
MLLPPPRLRQQHPRSRRHRASAARPGGRRGRLGAHFCAWLAGWPGTFTHRSMQFFTEDFPP